jgi:hypothetical protein
MFATLSAAGQREAGSHAEIAVTAEDSSKPATLAGRVMSVTLIVIAIALEPGDARVTAFERAARGVLGPEATLLLEHVADDPPDADSIARGARADGVVELTLGAEQARLHCYFSRQGRWVDREITFGPEGAPHEDEAAERGRLLGLAVGTMFAGDVDEPSRAAPPSPEPSRAPALPSPRPPDRYRPRVTASYRWTLEFSGTANAGIRGTASELGAAAGLRFGWVGPVALRAFVAGRAGSIPEAQATSRTVQLGAGSSLRLLPEASPWMLGVRADAMLSYFTMSHLSEDDLESDQRLRFLPGCDLFAEAGFRFSETLSLHVGAGVEAMFGSTFVYTHERRVAVVPPFRAVGELGVRAFF